MKVDKPYWRPILTEFLEIVYDQDHLNFDLWLDFAVYYREGGRIEHDIDMTLPSKSAT